MTSDDSRGLGACLDLRYPFHQSLRVEITALPWRPRSGKIAIPIGDNYLLRSCRASSQPWAGAKLTDLPGRRAERVAIEHLLAQAQAGRSGAVGLRGEAGIGKTAILEYTRDVAAASGFRVEYSVGVEPERQFAFAGLHQL
ncbi:AAA family ATPase [Streptosporangium sp. H16]|uniref:AAA family ATPase n=1 Tax=Streptosporangium sp. H16 TaxID=3444184 RepID=UPI003F798C1B